MGAYGLIELPLCSHAEKQTHRDQLSFLGRLFSSVSNGAGIDTVASGNSRPAYTSETTFSRPLKDQAGAWRNGSSFGLNDLEALMNVAFEAKEWMIAHTLKQ